MGVPDGSAHLSARYDPGGRGGFINSGLVWGPGGGRTVGMCWGGGN